MRNKNIVDFCGAQSDVYESTKSDKKVELLNLTGLGLEEGHQALKMGNNKGYTTVKNLNILEQCMRMSVLQDKQSISLSQG